MKDVIQVKFLPCACWHALLAVMVAANKKAEEAQFQLALPLILQHACE